MRWRASASGVERRQAARWTSSTRLGPTTHSDATSSIEPLPGLVAGGQRLAQQVLDVEDLDAALAHPGDELVVLPLGALDPQHVVEQQLVVVGRGQPLEAEVGPMDDDLAQLADLGVDAERRHALLRRIVSSATTCVPAAAVDELRRSASSEPIAARLPVAVDELGRGLDLRPHRARPAKSIASQLGRASTRSIRALVGVPQSA